MGTPDAYVTSGPREGRDWEAAQCIEPPVGGFLDHHVEDLADVTASAETQLLDDKIGQDIVVLSQHDPAGHVLISGIVDRDADCLAPVHWRALSWSATFANQLLQLLLPFLRRRLG